MPANSLSEQQGVAFSSKMPQVSQKVRAGERAEMRGEERADAGGEEAIAFAPVNAP